VKASSDIILHRLDSLLNSPGENNIVLRLQRLRTYVEYSLLHTEVMASTNPVDLERLASYSRAHPAHDMVLMYPEYITWRNK
jgi:hypothetical protein